jgi:hypothetical protein
MSAARRGGAAKHASARVYALRSHPVGGSVAERAWFGCLRGERKHRLLAVSYGDVEDKAELSFTMPSARWVWVAWIEEIATAPWQSIACHMAPPSRPQRSRSSGATRTTELLPKQGERSRAPHACALDI